MTDSTCRRCEYYWDGFDVCRSNAANCPYWRALTTGPTPIISGPSIRADLFPSWRVRLGRWFTRNGYDAWTWAMAAFAVAVFCLALAWGSR
jgi:hypothetical protein